MWCAYCDISNENVGRSKRLQVLVHPPGLSVESDAAGYHASVIPAFFRPESSGVPEVAIRLPAPLLQVHMGNIYGLDKLDLTGFRLKSPAGMTNRFPQMPNFGSPPAEPTVYPGELLLKRYGDDRDRTDDLSLAKAALSQLSYIPTRWPL